MKLQMSPQVDCAGLIGAYARAKPPSVR